MKEKDPDNAKGKCVNFLKPASGGLKESIEMVFITKSLLRSWSTVN